jgi:peroxin-5
VDPSSRSGLVRLDRRAADVNAGEPAAKELAAWSLLGKTHAMNEKEEKALAAFEEGRMISRDSEVSDRVADECGFRLTVSMSPIPASAPPPLIACRPSSNAASAFSSFSFMACAISYVNESADFEALQVLHQFLALVHPEHAGAAPQRSTTCFELY